MEKPDRRGGLLLPARRERPSRYATERSDEFAPSKAKPHLPLPCPASPKEKAQERDPLSLIEPVV
jgi:hypothetical protein